MREWGIVNQTGFAAAIVTAKALDGAENVYVQRAFRSLRPKNPGINSHYSSNSSLRSIAMEYYDYVKKIQNIGT